MPSPPLQLVDVGTASNVLVVHGTSLGQDNGWELHIPSEVCLVTLVWGGHVRCTLQYHNDMSLMFEINNIVHKISGMEHVDNNCVCL